MFLYSTAFEEWNSLTATSKVAVALLSRLSIKNYDIVPNHTYTHELGDAFCKR